MATELRPVGLAVIGCGRISASHLAALRDQPHLGRLVAVVDADLALAQEVAARYGAPHAFDDLAPALALDEVEAVLICTPNALHAEQTLAALAAGKHVLVEKPMADSEADAWRMAERADQCGLVLAVGHTFRHNAAVRYLQDHRAEFGTLRAVEISQCVFWDGPQAHWWATRTPEEGLILSLFAPHPLDFVQLVMGDDDPTRVHVEIARHQDGWRAEDEAMILMAYPGRRMVSLHISYNQSPIVDRKVLFFDRGVLRIENGEYLYWNDQLLVQPAANLITDPGKMGGRDLSGYFRLLLEEFVLAVRGRPHRSVLHKDGARLIALIERIRKVGRETSVGAV